MLITLRQKRLRLAGTRQKPAVEAFTLTRNDWVPNNERLPVLLYKAAVKPRGDDPAAACEDTFRANGWPPRRRNGVFTFQHYHSAAHEVLGVARGKARLMLGGENGREVTIRAGDVVVLPAGTGHCEIAASADLLTVSACPPDQHCDVCHVWPSEQARHRMARLPFPPSDPVIGVGGPLVQLWQVAQ
ncbi:MAG TPA: cupin domain-containing protein [Rhodopila sp.]|nr:cupin domain-containing protein [Rhodopila sp.]